ncbi:MAG: tetratricopeptide repeat protein [Bacteroidales bacterium]
MRKLTAILLLLAGSLSCPAQSPVDSLKHLLGLQGNEVRMDLYRSLAVEYLMTSTDKAIEAGNDALAIALKLKNPEKQDSAYELLADLYASLSQSANALVYFRKSLAISNRMSNTGRIAWILYKMGREEEFGLQNFDQAIIHYQEGLFKTEKDQFKHIRSDLLSGLGNCYRKKNDYTKAREYYQEALVIKNELNDKEGLEKLYSRIGLNWYDQGNIREAINWYEKSLHLQQKLNNVGGAAMSFVNIGNAYLDLEEYGKSLQSFQAAIRIFESIGDKQGMANCLNGIGIIYDHQHLFEKALASYQQSLAINEELGNEEEAANNRQNMGIIYSLRAEQKLNKLLGPDWKDLLDKPIPDSIRIDLQKSLEIQEAAMKSRINLKDTLGIAESLQNMGPLYMYLRQPLKALECFSEAAAIHEQTGNPFDLVLNIVGIGQAELQAGNIEQAISRFDQAVTLAEKNFQKEPLAESYLGLSRAWEKKGNSSRSLHYYKLYNDLHETILLEKGRKDLTEMQVKYDTENKDKEITILNKDNELKATRLKQQRTTIFFILAGLSLLILALWQTIRQVQLKRRANKVLQEKNEVISLQNDEIKKSIDSARFIQHAALLPEEQIRSILPHHFIFYRPRDIVSGDYYWFFEREGKVVAVAADCTGHGVPGALTSMLGISFLNQVVAQKNILHPDEILGEMRTLVVESLHQAGMDEGRKAGMDMAVVMLDFKNRQIEYAGAKNPLILIKKGELLEIDADRTGVGMAWGEEKPYTRHHFDMDTGDHLYIFSDGLADQFGGEKGKKFMSKNLKKVLLDLSALPFAEQLPQLENVMDNWRGKQLDKEGKVDYTYEQVDDNLLIGIAVKD